MGRVIVVIIWLAQAAGVVMSQASSGSAVYLEMKNGQRYGGYPLGRSQDWITWYVYDQGREVEQRIAVDDIQAIVFSGPAGLESVEIGQLRQELGKRRLYLDLLPASEYPTWVDYLLHEQIELSDIERVRMVRQMQSPQHQRQTMLQLVQIEVIGLVRLGLLDEALAAVEELAEIGDLSAIGESFVVCATAYIRLELEQEEAALQQALTYIRAYPYRSDAWAIRCYQIVWRLLGRFDSAVAAEQFALSAGWRGVEVDTVAALAGESMDYQWIKQ